MTDYFKELYNKLKSENSTMEILESNISESKMEHGIDLSKPVYKEIIQRE